MDVKSLCRVCNNFVSASQFRLHHDYKQMVCPTCFTGKTKQQEEQKLEMLKKQEANPKPAGWDNEDDYLEKRARIKREENQAQFTKILGTSQVKAQCSACKYTFRYDPVNKKPFTCPYCNADIPKLKTFNLA